MKEDYIKRVNTILSYIEANLSNDLSLESIAAVAFYSPFHLHRLFKAITGETLNTYITRKRIERAALQLIHAKDISITAIAMNNGFNSNSSFARTFTKLYGISPSAFRNAPPNELSKIGKVNSKNSKVNFITEEYFCNINHHKNWIDMNAKIEIKEMPKMELAYLTQIGVAGIENTFMQLMKWAMPKGLLAKPNAHLVRVFHDSFKITDEDKVRMSIGVILHEPIKTDGVISLMTIEKGKHLVGRFEIEVKDFEISWNALFLWMSEQGYKKADRLPYEIYYNNPAEHPENKCIVELCIPVE